MKRFNCLISLHSSVICYLFSLYHAHSLCPVDKNKTVTGVKLVHISLIGKEAEVSLDVLFGIKIILKPVF